MQELLELFAAAFCKGGCEAFRVAQEKEFLIDNLLVRVHFVIEMIWWTGLAPWEFKKSLFQAAVYLLNHLPQCRSFWSGSRRPRQLPSLPSKQGYLAHKTPPPPWDPTVVLCLGTYGDPRGVGVSYERGIPAAQPSRNFRLSMLPT